MPAGRPQLPPGEGKTERVVLSLTPGMLDVLDDLVASDKVAESRQQLLTFLIRDEAKRRDTAAARRATVKKTARTRKGSR